MASDVVLRVDDEVLLSFAEEVGEDGPVSVEGGRTRWDDDLLPGTRLLRAPVGIVDYKPEEMTIQVRAGTTVADLDAALAERGQRCALPDRGGTVGGAVAVGEDHLGVLGRGPVRDAVLQVRYVSAEGRCVTGGGPVVKNVSGFNLPKLMVGSLGTLGCLAEFVLRTNPIPARSIWIESADADPFVVADTILRPGAILWDGTLTKVLLEGHEADVQAERRALGATGTFAESDPPETLPANRWSLPPGAIRDLDTAATGAFVASIGVGRVWAELPSPPVEHDPIHQMLEQRMKQNFDPTGRLNPGRRP